MAFSLNLNDVFGALSHINNPLGMVTTLAEELILPQATPVVLAEKAKLDALKAPYQKSQLVANVVGACKHQLRHHIGWAADVIFGLTDVQNYLTSFADQIVSTVVPELQ